MYREKVEKAMRDHKLDHLVEKICNKKVLEEIAQFEDYESLTEYLYDLGVEMIAPRVAISRAALGEMGAPQGMTHDQFLEMVEGVKWHGIIRDSLYNRVFKPLSLGRPYFTMLLKTAEWEKVAPGGEMRVLCTQDRPLNEIIVSLKPDTMKIRTGSEESDMPNWKLFGEDLLMKHIAANQTKDKGKASTFAPSTVTALPGAYYVRMPFSSFVDLDDEMKKEAERQKRYAEEYQKMEEELRQQREEHMAEEEAEREFQKEEALHGLRDEPAFAATFTEEKLGIALGNDARGHVTIKRCLPGSVAENRRLPPGYYVLDINGTSTVGKNIKQVQKMIQLAERPMTINFTKDAPSA